jgi:2-pyrone-4,6-dicarboxylate lactonase
MRLPPGACDAHAQVLGPRARFPYTGKGPPADAPKEALFAWHEHLGIERAVVVQSRWHGFDNWVTTDALAARSGRYRGIARVPADVAPRELLRLDALGFCGVAFRFSSERRASVPLERVLALAPHVAHLGWHLELGMDSRLVADLGPRLRRLPVPVIIDGLSAMDDALRTLMRSAHVWIKLRGVPGAFGREVMERFGDRAVWGSGWPQSTDALTSIAPGPSEQHALLVDNPQRLYRFPVARLERKARPVDERRAPYFDAPEARQRLVVAIEVSVAMDERNPARHARREVSEGLA